MRKKVSSAFEEITKLMIIFLTVVFVACIYFNCMGVLAAYVLSLVFSAVVWMILG